jgi:hypothetical protein
MGPVTRRSYREAGSGFMADAESIRLNSEALVPRLIDVSPEQSIRVENPAVPEEGMILCFPE